MLNRDYSMAVEYLETAHLLDPFHRGMHKAFGFSYLWDGQVEAALLLLSSLPEIEYEVANYIYQWREQNRADMADKAEFYLEMANSE